MPSRGELRPVPSILTTKRVMTMWRALVLAIGISLGILGAEFMVVDRIVIADPDSTSSAQQDFGSPTLSTWSTPLNSKRRVFIPPEWAPWGFLSAGVMLVLYGASLGRSD